MHKAYYEENQDPGVYIPSEKRELAQSMNVDHHKWSRRSEERRDHLW